MSRPVINPLCSFLQSPLIDSKHATPILSSAEPVTLQMTRAGGESSTTPSKSSTTCEGITRSAIPVVVSKNPVAISNHFVLMETRGPFLQAVRPVRAFGLWKWTISQGAALDLVVAPLGQGLF